MKSIAAGALLLALYALGCDRDRSNPLDPQANLVEGRPATPVELSVRGDVGVIRLSWKPVTDPDLAGYAVLRSAHSNGTFSFVAGEGDSTAGITTGKTTYVDTIHVGNLTFFYRVASVDTNGLRSELSGFVGATSLSDDRSPGAPHSLSAVASERAGEVLIRWSAPLTDSGGEPLSGLSGYVVLRSESGAGGLVPVDTLSAGVQEYRDTGLKSRTTYSYSVVAFDAVGNTSSASAAVSVTSSGLSSPAGLRASAGIGRIEVSWSSVGASSLVGYDVYRSSTSDGAYRRLPGGEGTSFTTGLTSYVDSNLSGGRRYYYKVRSVGVAGVVSELSGFVGATSLSDDRSPGAPHSLSAVASESAGEVLVRWSAPLTDSGGEPLSGLSGYVVLRSESGAGGLVPVDTLSAGVQEYRDTGLKSRTTYSYSVVAFDALGNTSSASAAVSVTSSGLSSPAGLRASAGIGRIEVSWSSVGASSLVGYDVYRSSTSDGAYRRLPGGEGTSFTTGLTSYVDSNLPGGQRYYYKVRSVGVAGVVSELSGFVGATSLSDDRSPGAPHSLSAVASESSGEVLVRWSAPLTDSGGEPLSGLSGYVVLRSESGAGGLVPVDTLSAGVQEYRDTGLKSRTTYSYSVVAFDAVGNTSSASAAVSVTSSGLSSPAGLRASAGIGRIEVSWSSVGASSLVGYDVYRSSTSDGAYRRLPGGEGTSFTTGLTSYVDSNLPGGRRYYYKVRSVGVAGVVSELSGFVGATSLSDDRSPGAPHSLSAVASERAGEVLVRWSAPLTDSGGEPLSGLSGYVVLRSESGAGGLVPVDTLSAGVQEYRDTGLKSRTTYSYSVVAFDALGNTSSASAAVSVTSSGLSSPAGLRASAGIGRIEVSWSSVGASSLVGYDVYRSSTSDGAYRRLPGGEGTSFTTGLTSYVDSNLPGGQRYYYKVRSVGVEGVVSELSGFVGATSLSDDRSPGSPTSLSAVASERAGEVLIRWSAPLTDSGGEPLSGLSGYVVLRSESGAGGLVPVDTLSAGVQEYRDTGLKSRTTYSYSVVAFDAVGNTSSASAAVSVTSSGLSSPAGLRASAGIGRIEVSWSSVGASSLVGYDVYRSSTSDGAYRRLPGGEGTSFTTGLTSYVDSNLSGGRRYYYKVRSVGVEGVVSELSGFVGATSLSDDRSPGAPHSLSAVASESSGEVLIRWSAPLTDSGGEPLSGLSGYVVLRSESGAGGLVPVDTLSAGVQEYRDTGLKSRTTYSYSVVAFDAVGNTSSASAAVSVTSSGLSSPAGLRASAGIGRIEVSWSSVGASSLVGYDVYRSSTSDGAYRRLPGGEGTSFTTGLTSYVDSNLPGGQRYYYKVRSVGVEGVVSELSGFVGATSLSDDRSPGAPHSLSAVASESSGEVLVRWSAPLTDSGGEPLSGLSGYVVLRSESGAGGLVPVDTLSAGVQEYRDTGLKSRTTYSYSVVAFDAVGNTSSASAAVSVTSSGLSSPAGLRASAGIGRIEVSWSSVGASSLVGYDVYRSSTSDGAYRRLPGGEGTSFTTGLTSYVDSNLPGGQRYYYKVRSVGVEGVVSELSGFVGATSLSDDRSPEPPPGVAAVADASDPSRITLSWGAPSRDAGGGTLTGLSGFILLRAEGDGSFVRAASLGADKRRFDDTGLKSLTTYRYALIAVDGAGNESALSAVAQVTTTGVPAPSAVTADDGIGRIELNWAAVHHVDLLGYNVYRATRPDQPFSRLDGDGGEAFSTGRTTFVDSSLAAGQLFYYKVTTVTAEFESDPSVLVSATAAADDVAPATPTGLVAIAADDRAEVSLRWTRPRTDQDGGDLTGLRSFVVYRAQDGPGALSAVDTVDAGSSAFTDTGLEPATTYYYSVSATDGSGNVSPRAQAVSATTPGISPPAALSTSGEVTRITVSWNASDEDDLLGYNVYRSTRPDEGYARLTGAEGTPFTTGQTSYVDSNLTGGQILYYRVSVVTSSGESDPSAFSGATVLVDLQAPEAPSLVTGRPVPGHPDQLELSWRPPRRDENGGRLTGVSGYVVYRADEDGGEFTELGSTVTSTFVDTDLSQRTTYYYQVEAFDAEGNLGPRSQTASATTAGVDLPTHVRLVAATPSNPNDRPVVTITWTASKGAILRYEVQRTTVANSTRDGDYTEVLPHSVGTTREDDTVRRGQTYYYRVRAVDIDDRVSEWTEPLGITVSE